MHTLRGHMETVYGLAWSPNSQVLASVSMDHTVCTWDINQAWQARWVGRAHTARVNRVSWHPDGTQLATCGEDHAVRLWRAEDGTELNVLRAHHQAVADVAFSPDGRMLALSGGGGSNAELSVWDPATWQRLRTLIGHESVVFALAWSPSSDYLVSGGSNGSLRWWHVPSGECVRRQDAHAGWVRSLDVSPDGSVVASGAEDGVIRLWDMPAGTLLRELRPDRPYERLNITGIRGLTEAQKATLRALGAIESD
jgi:WD40 repeat protein